MKVRNKEGYRDLIKQKERKKNTEALKKKETMK